jgi:hypothetical protein
MTEPTKKTDQELDAEPELIKDLDLDDDDNNGEVRGGCESSGKSFGA